MAEIPVWTIILGVIGGLWSLIVLLLGLFIKRTLDDIKETLRELAEDDRKALDKIGSVERELSQHKLHVSETYVRIDQHQATINAIFNTLRETKEEIVGRVQELVRHLEARINHYNDPHSQ